MRDKIKEYATVEAAALKFVRSVAEGNSFHAKELFTEDAVLFGMLDGVMERGSIERFYHKCRYGWCRRRLQSPRRCACCGRDCISSACARRRVGRTH